jgi:hypothetical protein
VFFNVKQYLYPLLLWLLVFGFLGRCSVDGQLKVCWIKQKGLLRRNGAASNDCLPYENLKIYFELTKQLVIFAFRKLASNDCRHYDCLLYERLQQFKSILSFNQLLIKFLLFILQQTRIVLFKALVFNLLLQFLTLCPTL